MVKAETRTRTATSLLALWATYLQHCSMLAHAADNFSAKGRQEENSQGQPVGIVIMAQGRSGSTMLGETFRQNKVGAFFVPSRVRVARKNIASNKRRERQIQ